jgi:hypothetical protein
MKKGVVAGLAGGVLVLYLSSPFILLPLKLKYNVVPSIPLILWWRIADPLLGYFEPDSIYATTFSAYFRRVCPHFPESCSVEPEPAAQQGVPADVARPAGERRG